jgi:hypothetical protein
LIPDISGVIYTFLQGCLSSWSRIQDECINAISFIVTHKLVYTSSFEHHVGDQNKAKVLKEIENSEVQYILDAIMYTSGNEDKLIRTTAFSTLSSLSKYSSQCKSVMA